MRLIMTAASKSSFTIAYGSSEVIASTALG